jgi:hypothetical protein
MNAIIPHDPRDDLAHDNLHAICGHFFAARRAPKEQNVVNRA